MIPEVQRVTRYVLQAVADALIDLDAGVLILPWPPPGRVGEPA